MLAIITVSSANDNVWFRCHKELVQYNKIVNYDI